MGIIEKGNRRRLNKEIDTNAVFASKAFSGDILTYVPNDTPAIC